MTSEALFVAVFTFVVGLIVGAATNYALVSGRIATLEANYKTLMTLIGDMKEDLRREIHAAVEAAVGYERARPAVHRP